MGKIMKKEKKEKGMFLSFFIAFDVGLYKEKYVKKN